MKLKVCEYCGTEYKGDLERCPLCGKADGEPTAAEKHTGKRRGARVAPAAAKKEKKQKSEQIPQWMWAVFCIVLGLAVLIGLVYFLVSMDYIGGKDTPPVVQETVVPEVDPVNEPELLEPMPEIEPVPEEEPVDLSCVDLTLNQTEIVLDEKGSAVFLTAVPTPVDCTDPIVFNTMDEVVATVDQNGMITAISAGRTEVLVTCGGEVRTCIVICDFVEEEEVPEDPADSETEETEPEEETPEENQSETEPEEAPEIKLSTDDFTLFRPGEEATVKVLNAPADAVITFTSSDQDVVTVTDKGVVKAIGNGVASISVMINDRKLICVARCRLEETAENTEGDTSETVSGPLALYNPLGNATDVMLFSVGESFSLSLVDSDGNKASGVNWSTSNGAICSVDANGRVTALGKGTATVTATYNGQSYTCIVRCNF